MKVRRAGWLTAPDRAASDISRYSSQTRFTLAYACTASPVDVTASAVPVTSTSRRRSTASAMAPPSSPTVMDGTAAHSASAPTAADECVSVYTCSATANIVIWVPIADSPEPTHRRRKAGDSRSGVTSMNRRVIGAPAGRGTAGRGLRRRRR